MQSSEAKDHALAGDADSLAVSLVPSLRAFPIFLPGTPSRSAQEIIY